MKQSLHLQPGRSDEGITRSDRLRLARELVLGAPIAALIWLLLLRWILGSWSFAFPLLIILVSLLLALLMTGPAIVSIPAYRFWRGLIGVIDWVVTRIVCLFLFYLIFTPLGLLLRLLRVPLLRLKGEAGRGSYWQTPRERPDGKRRFIPQY